MGRRYIKQPKVGSYVIDPQTNQAAKVLDTKQHGQILTVELYLDRTTTTLMRAYGGTWIRP